MWPNQSFLNVSTFYFCSKNIGSNVFDSETTFHKKTLILGVRLQALTSISHWVMAEILDKELELICWRANTQSWTTAEHHGLRCNDKTPYTCVQIWQCVYWKQLRLVQMSYMFVYFYALWSFSSFPTSNNKTGDKFDKLNSQTIRR